MPPLPADSIHARACKLKCEKILTRPKTQRDSDYTKLKDTRAEVAELQKIRKCVDIALRADQPEQTQSRTKRHEQER